MGGDYVFFVGSFLRLVFAKSLSCFSDMDSAISFDAPFRLDFGVSPRLAANAAPAAICCFFERAGIELDRFAGVCRIYPVTCRKASGLAIAPYPSTSCLWHVSV
jgi:hypothetical protein